MRWSELLAEVGASDHGGPDVDVDRVTRDSREVVPGSVFVAIRGERIDGHGFVGTLPAGAAVILGRRVPVPEGVAWAVVAAPRRALALAAAALEGHPSRRVPCVGVTGTNGKTTTTTLLAGALGHLGWPTTRVGTTGSDVLGAAVPPGLTTPEAPTLQRWIRETADGGGRAVLLEASSIGLALHRVDGIAFHVGVFTTLGRDHLDFHGTEAAYVAAKARLFTELLRPAGGLPRALLCGDDPDWERMQAPDDRWIYGLDGGDIHVRDVAERTLTIATPMGEATVRSPLPGVANARNVAAALGAGLLLGAPLADLAHALGEVRGPPGRMERVFGGGVEVWVDYAHTPDALAEALDAVRAVTPGKVWVVFGCGGDRDRRKRPEMGRASLSADRVLVTSDNPRSEDPEAIVADILAGIPEGGAVVELDRGRAIHRAVAEAAPGDAVLIAGKGHETTQVLADATVPFDDRAVARAALEAR